MRYFIRHAEDDPKAKYGNYLYLIDGNKNMTLAWKKGPKGKWRKYVQYDPNNPQHWHSTHTHIVLTYVELEELPLELRGPEYSI